MDSSVKTKDKVMLFAKELFNYSEGKMLQVLDRLESDGYDLLRFIDSGSYGVVIYIGNDRVLKITADKTEANAMNIVMQHPHPNIVQVFRVWKYAAFKDIWFIEQEKLDKVNSYMYFTDWFMDLKLKNEDDYIVEKDLKMIFDGRCNIDNLLGYITDNYLEKEKIDWIKNHLGYKEVLQLICAAEHLSKYKIKFYDWIGSGNIMQKNGIYKVTDLGQSQAPNSNIELKEILDKS